MPALAPSLLVWGGARKSGDVLTSAPDRPEPTYGQGPLTSRPHCNTTRTLPSVVDENGHIRIGLNHSRDTIGRGRLRKLPSHRSTPRQKRKGKGNRKSGREGDRKSDWRGEKKGGRKGGREGGRNKTRKRDKKRDRKGGRKRDGKRDGKKDKKRDKERDGRTLRRLPSRACSTSRSVYFLESAPSLQEYRELVF